MPIATFWVDFMASYLPYIGRCELRIQSVDSRPL